MVKPIKIIKCPACGCTGFVPYVRNDKRLAKCLQCAKEYPEEQIYTPGDCEGECKI